MAGKREDLLGIKFNHLTVVDYSSDHITKSGIHVVMWKCKCDCGNTVNVAASSLKSGNTKACGCLKRNPLEKRTIHGLSRTRNYRILREMKSRCYNTKNKYYQNYGGRGITICDEWLNDYLTFYKWSIDNGYTDELTIDRIDNSKGYSPDNCRWVTRTVQMNNTRSNRFIYYKGMKLTVAQAAKKYGLKEKTLWGRLHNGWNDETAIETPLLHRPYNTCC